MSNASDTGTAASDAALAEATLVDGELVDAAYAEVMADGGVQTAFPPPKVAEAPSTPQWLIDALEAIARALEWAAPAARPLLIAAGILALIWLVWRLSPALRAWLARRRGGDDAAPADPIEVTRARALLAEADALAAGGNFAGAVHLLLLRGVADIASNRPALVRPSRTSRDLAAAADLPPPIAGAFARIAEAVEISRFGGRSIDAAAWQTSRDAYGALTVARNWAAA